MQKEFTVNVPDQLWVNSWEDELTKTYTYEGPQYFYIGLDYNLSPLELRYGDDEVEADDFTEEEASSFQYVITVNAEDNPDLAQLLHPGTSDTDHTFGDETNHDGSIYRIIANPNLKNYFVVDYRINSSSPDQAECFANPIYKETSNILKTTATSRLEQVKKYNNAYDFDDSDQAKIDSFILAINTYLETVETAYPWKYITMDITEIPKIPVSIQLLFNQLPETD